MAGTQGQIGFEGGKDMLVVDDRFKSWMRQRLHDSSYVDRLVQKIAGAECSVLEVWPHAALPIQRKGNDDPEAMIGLIKCHDHKDESDFLLAFFGDWKSFKDMSQEYIYHFWHMYGPEYTGDFEHLPRIHEVAFLESDSEEEIMRRRWKIEISSDGKITDSLEYEDLKVDLINTSVDSKIMRIVTGKDRAKHISDDMDVAEGEIGSRQDKS